MANEPFSMQLEVIGDAENPADAATLGEIVYGVVTELRKEQYSVEPVYTGEKGGQELFELWKTVESGINFALQHQTEIATFAVSISTIINSIHDVQEKLTAKRKTSLTIKITVVNTKKGTSKIVEGNDRATVVSVVKELEAEPGQTKLMAHVQQPAKRRRR